MMRQLFVPEPLTEELYAEMDPEMVSLVRALNQFDFMRTFDSCFGHTPAERPDGNQQPDAFVGLSIRIGDGSDPLAFQQNEVKFLDFFAFLLEDTYAGLGKLFTTPSQNQGVSITLSQELYPNRNAFFTRLHIRPLRYDNMRAQKEFGIGWILNRIDQYKNAGGFFRREKK